MRDKAIPELSQGHKNTIATTLAVLDEALCEFEQWAEGREIKSIFYREANELQPEQREAIKNQVARLREKLMEMRGATARGRSPECGATHLEPLFDALGEPD